MSAPPTPPNSFAQIPPYFDTSYSALPPQVPTAPTSPIVAALLGQSMHGGQPGMDYSKLVPSKATFDKFLGKGTPIGDWIRQQTNELLPNGLGSNNSNVVPGTGVFGSDYFGSSYPQTAQGVTSPSAAGPIPGAPE